MAKTKIQELSAHDLVDYIRLSEIVCGIYEKIMRGNHALKEFEGSEHNNEYVKYTSIHTKLVNESKKRLEEFA